MLDGMLGSILDGMCNSMLGNMLGSMLIGMHGSVAAYHAKWCSGAVRCRVHAVVHAHVLGNS